MKKKSFIFALVVVLLAVTLTSCVSTGDAKKTTASKTSSSDLFDGFNDSTTWRAVGKNWGDGDISTGIEITTDWATEGKGSFKGSFTQETSGSATYYTEMFDITDFSPYEGIYFDVKNDTTTPCQVALAITTGGAWEWYESPVFDIPVGETKDLCVDLYNNSLKAAPSNWQFTLNLGDSDDVRRVAIKFMFEEKTSGNVYIDNIRLK